ncbi:hypothetical protein MRX96_018458 [Rhipicephalus microplus]
MMRLIATKLGCQLLISGRPVPPQQINAGLFAAKIVYESLGVRPISFVICVSAATTSGTLNRNRCRDPKVMVAAGGQRAKQFAVSAPPAAAAGGPIVQCQTVLTLPPTAGLQARDCQSVARATRATRSQWLQYDRTKRAHHQFSKRTYCNPLFTARTIAHDTRMRSKSRATS